MLNRLVDVLLEFLELFYFVEIVDEYQRGVVLRFGRHHRDIEPGACFYWPFRIERPMVISVVPDITRLPTQSFTLRDGVTVAVTPAITYRVHNVKTALLEVEDAETALLDATSGEIRRLLADHDWCDLLDPEACAEIENQILKGIRREAFRWGFEVTRASFPDLVRLRGAYQLYGRGIGD